ncbi:MAG: hypothetical protein EXS08_08660 [Planctomycetes bacterium]|nr:hypothetical protein [Planctomycetota bacterium]
MKIQAKRPSRAQGGNATVIAVLTLFVIGSMAGLVLTVTQRHSAETSAMVDQNHAFFVAQAGANEGLARFGSGDHHSIGSADAMVEFSGGRYWVDVQDTGDDTFTLTTYARSGLQEKAIEVVVEQVQQGVFRNGVFAGNSSDDPSYVMPFSGTGGQADEVHGDIYSGGSVKVTGNASIDGTIRAFQSVSGGTSSETG